VLEVSLCVDKGNADVDVDVDVAVVAAKLLVNVAAIECEAGGVLVFLFGELGVDINPAMQLFKKLVVATGDSSGSPRPEGGGVAVISLFFRFLVRFFVCINDVNGRLLVVSLLRCTGLCCVGVGVGVGVGWGPRSNVPVVVRLWGGMVMSSFILSDNVSSSSNVNDMGGRSTLGAVTTLPLLLMLLLTLTLTLLLLPVCVVVPMRLVFFRFFFRPAEDASVMRSFKLSMTICAAVIPSDNAVLVLSFSGSVVVVVGVVPAVSDGGCFGRHTG